MRLLLMRHGQTHANVSGELDTAHPGVDLTDLGRAQAAAAAAAIGDRPIDAVYVSSRVRTHQTAAPAAEQRGLDLRPLDGLEEIAAGDFEMRSDHDAALLVSHGAALRTWVSQRMEPSDDAPPAHQPLHNTALIVLDGDGDTGWRLVSWQGHPVGGDLLEDDAAEDPTGDLDSDGDGEIG